jgi:hypothetical protein
MYAFEIVMQLWIIPMSATKINTCLHLFANRRHAAAAVALAASHLLTACASMPHAAAELPWSDERGSRGHGVLNRDFLECEALVENMRWQLRACMAKKGWSLDPPGGS